MKNPLQKRQNSKIDEIEVDKEFFLLVVSQWTYQKIRKSML